MTLAYRNAPQSYLTLWEVGELGLALDGALTDGPFCHHPRRAPRQWGTLWDKIDASGDGCWPYIGARFKGTEYGAYWVAGKVTKAHRAVFEAINGPTAARVLHTCDNPPCCNPADLFTGTMSDNSRDMVAKGRGPAGVEPRLTDDQVRLIRTLRRRGWTLARIGELVGCHWVHVSNIVNGKRRQNVADRPDEAVA